MEEQLIKLERVIPTAKFLEAQPIANLNSLKPKADTKDCEGDYGYSMLNIDSTLDNVNILQEWPVIQGNTMDESQMEALKRIITRKLAIVQGPPGTGKTHVSVSALRLMVDNWSPGDPPIIISAQTNHAIDQILKLIGQNEPKIVRLGGRTEKENEAIKQRTLFEVRAKAPPESQTGSSNYRNAKKAIEAHSYQLQADILHGLRQTADEIDSFLSNQLISQAQYDDLKDDKWTTDSDPNLPAGPIANWLSGSDLTYGSIGLPPMNLGFIEEEVDAEFEQLDENEMEKVKIDEDEINSLRGMIFDYKEHLPVMFTCRRGQGLSDTRIAKLLRNSPSLFEIPEGNRGEVYRYLRRKLVEKVSGQFHEHLGEYIRSVKCMKVGRWQSDATMIMRLGIKIIGCTTTGLSKYRGLLAALKPRTLLIEEAAETTEGTVLAAMFESIQQLILVGDHQQLQAHCNVSRLSQAPFNLGVSMFERLVNNGLDYTMLNTQRRMVPEIRKLLTPFYDGLKDHQYVFDRAVNRPPVPGMGGRNLYFFSHKWPESRDESSSCFNIDEAEMIAGFVEYLVLNGTPAEKITVLTFYNGQRKVIISFLKRRPGLMGTTSFKVFTVDSYQGEENDIILLSLVRSNDIRSIGFLDNKNRAVVAVSRARRGLYIFGNAICLVGATQDAFHIWGDIIDEIKNDLGFELDNPGLPIVCQRHGNKRMITYAEQWVGSAGGCYLKCDGLLPCGHMCYLDCHP
jgi:helicase required for RNAi-mediated heterochromatin assembly 1